MTRLDELDKTETRDLVRRVLPALTDEQFEKVWAEFVAMKSEWLKNRTLQ